METLQRTARISLRDKAPTAAVDLACALNIVVVYQDALTLDWAMQQCQRAARLAGDLCAQSSWWKLHYLSSPEILLPAVQAASVADIVMVSVLAFEDPPPGLQDWIDAWLVCRLPGEGTLIALIGVPEPSQLGPFQAREFLRAVAKQAQLGYVAHERALSVEPSDLAVEKNWKACFQTLPVAREMVALVGTPAFIARR